MLGVWELPYLTADAPGVGGRIKTRPEDFIVEEVPLYDPSGQGTHVYFRVRKTGLSTMEAVRLLARALGRPPQDFGYAGLKDADAVATQMLSLEHVDPDRVKVLSLPRIEVLSVSRHGNKIKLGHLSGNRFAIKLRGVDVNRAGDVQAMMEGLRQRGVPNYFGPQRFGLRGDTWQVGRAMLWADYAEAVAVVLGRPDQRDHGDVARARESFERGDYEAAAKLWPHPFHNERRLCRALCRTKGNPGRAFSAVDKQGRRFYISAYQSHLFNQVVARRIHALDLLATGDLAWLHPSGKVFCVEDAAQEQPRCAAFDISPSGPLFGCRLSLPTGQPGELERALLAEENMTLDDWRQAGRHKVSGGRRPLRFQPHHPEVTAGLDDAGPYIELRFSLEPGCYATAVLREVCKSPLSRSES